MITVEAEESRTPVVISGLPAHSTIALDVPTAKMLAVDLLVTIGLLEHGLLPHRGATDDSHR